MSEIHVYTAEGAQTVYPEERVVEFLRSGELAPEALFWRQGMRAWQPLSTFQPAPTPAPPPPSHAFVPDRHTEPLPEFSARHHRQTLPGSSSAARPPGTLRVPRVHFRRYPEPLTTVLQVFLLVCIGLAGLQLADGLVRYNLISTQVPGLTGSPAQGGGSLFTNFREAVGSTGNLLYWVATGMDTLLLLPYFMWIYQAVINSRNFSFIVRYSPGWSVGCNFVPALNLYLPCIVMQEIWKVSRNPRTWHNDRPSVLVGIWWALWLARIVMLRIPLVLARKAQTPHDLVNVALSQTVQSGFEFVFYGVFFALITVIVQNQKQLVAASRRARESSTAAASAPASTP